MSVRQILVLLFCALISPMVQALPTLTAATAGEGAWLTGLLAFPALLVMYAVVHLLLRTVPGGGLAQVFQMVLGKVLGGALTILYGVWALFLLCLHARLYAERMLSVGYRNASMAILLLVLLAMLLWQCSKKLAAFARSVEIFYLALSLGLGLVLFFSVSQMALENVLPIWVEDLPGIATATLVPLGVAGMGIYAAFLGGQIAPRDGDKKRCVKWLAVACLVMAALQFGVLGQLGPELSVEIDQPFYVVAESVGIYGAFQRVESVIIALWVFSDLALLGLLVFSCRTMVGAILGERRRRWLVPALLALTFLGAMFLLPDEFMAREVASRGMLIGNLILGCAVPALLLLVRRVKQALA